MKEKDQKLHKVTVKKNKVGDGVLHGAITDIYLDDKKIEGCTFFKFEVKPRKIAKVTIEILVDNFQLGEICKINKKEDKKSPSEK